MSECKALFLLRNWKDPAKMASPSKATRPELHILHMCELQGRFVTAAAEAYAHTSEWAERVEVGHGQDFIQL